MRYWAMLAKPGTIADLERTDLVYEPKMDGVRCLAYISEQVSLYSRTGKDITRSFPDVAKQLDHLTAVGQDLVLDGEIVVPYESPKNPLVTLSDFQALQTRLQRKVQIDTAIARHPASYVAFDVLTFSGQDTASRPFVRRREILEGLPLQKPPQVHSPHAAAHFAYMTAAGLEGFMAKQLDAPYLSGQRTKYWLKIKPTLQRIVNIVGVTHGYGKRAPYFGALIIADDDWNYLGNVGTGLDDKTLEYFSKVLPDYILPKDKRIIFSDKEPQHVKYWIVPGVFEALISYQEVTRDGMLRFPTLLEIIS